MEAKRPSLRHEPISGLSEHTGSSTSSDFTYSQASSGSDSSLPIRIDALLSNKSYFSPPTTSPEPKPTSFFRPQPPSVGGTVNGFHSPPPASSSVLPRPASRDKNGVVQNGAQSLVLAKGRGAMLSADPSLDGMSALLKAGEIVGRRTR
jgi:hypothetical protein